MRQRRKYRCIGWPLVNFGQYQGSKLSGCIFCKPHIKNKCIKSTEVKPAKRVKRRQRGT